MDNALAIKMIPVGYMFKKVARHPDWIVTDNIVDMYSVGGCVSENFADYIQFWKHNGYWLFNSPAVMKEIAAEKNIDLSGMTLFYYECYEYEFDLPDQSSVSAAGQWSKFACDSSFLTYVEVPGVKRLAGYDVTEFVCRNSPECSLIGCVPEISMHISGINSHGLFDSFQAAKAALESGIFHRHEPGPYRILAVYLVDCNPFGKFD